MNLLKALSTVSALTLLSRITGLVRESLKAVGFGAGLQMDAFEAAFRLPNILRRLFAEGAFSQAFVPILAEYKRARGDDATRDLVSRVATLLAVLLLALSVLGIFAAPWLVYLLAGGFVRTPGKVELTAELIRIMFPYVFFISLVSLAGGVLNVHRRFAIPAFTPVLLNVSIICATIFVAPHVDPPIVALAWGVAVGGVAQLTLQVVPLARLAMLPRPRFDWRTEGAPRGARRLGGADLDADQHPARGVPRGRTDLLDHLCGPADGIPKRDARRRLGDGAAAQPRPASPRRKRRRVSRAPRLGPEADILAGAAGGACTGVACRAADLDPVSIRTLYAQRRVADARCTSGLQRRPYRPYRRQDSRAGLLCAAGHENPG